MRTKEDVISDMQRRCSRKQAVQLAAEFVLLHISGSIRISTLETQFGNAMMDILDRENTEVNHEDRTK